jgi:hypothetical protein
MVSTRRWVLSNFHKWHKRTKSQRQVETVGVIPEFARHKLVRVYWREIISAKHQSHSVEVIITLKK